MTNNIEMFKSYDIRSRESKLNVQIKKHLADSIATYLAETVKVKSVVICRDTRLYAPGLAEIVMDVLLSAGLNIYLNPNPVSTCQFYYTCMKHRTSAGLMFTASHNPGEYVGIKLVAPDLIPISMENGPEGGLKTIKELYIKNAKPAKAPKTGKTTIVNELDSYIDYSMKLAGVKEGSLKGLNIMIECLNGSVGFEQALAFQKAGANVSTRHIIPNGFFPCGDPNPIVESSIAPARKAMKNGNFHLGFCFDGDGDRMDLMDKNGNQIIPSHNLAIIAPHIKSEIFKDTKSHIFCDPKALPTSMIEIAKTGITPHNTRNGHSFIKASLKQHFKDGYFAAVEESAHYYMCFPYNPEKITNKASDFAVTESTLFYSLLTARCYKENPKLYEPVKESVYREREWAVQLKDEKTADKIIAQLDKKFINLGATITKTMEDGNSLDCSLIRYNLPESFNKDTKMSNKEWFQLVMRISRSEDAIMRFEISSNKKSTLRKVKSYITL